MCGMLNNCTFHENFAGYGGAVARATLLDCILSNNVACEGGAAFESTLNRCSLIGNSAFKTSIGVGGYGGGAMEGTLDNCLVASNFCVLWRRYHTCHLEQLHGNRQLGFCRWRWGGCWHA